MNFTGTVIGDDRAVARFSSMPGVLREALKEGIGRAALLVQARTKTKLSGEVLNVRTGRLRRSINEAVTEEPSRVVGSVGTNVEYARVHELGFDGVVSVREQLRISKRGKAFTVRAHERHVHLPERSFLRSSLHELAPEIRGEFEAAVQRAVRAA